VRDQLIDSLERELQAEALDRRAPGSALGSGTVQNFGDGPQLNFSDSVQRNFGDGPGR
jgi:hypothetical protein